MGWATGGHHVLGFKLLLCELRYCQVLLAALGCEVGGARLEEVQVWEGHHISGQLAQGGVELTRVGVGAGNAAM